MAARGRERKREGRKTEKENVERMRSTDVREKTGRTEREKVRESKEVEKELKK